MTEFELEPGEIVVRQTRKHWLLFVTGLLPYAILAVLPLALPNLLSLTPQIADYFAKNNYLDARFVRMTYGIWLLFVWTGAWSSFTRYYLNVWVLTSQRIVDIEQRRFFSREVSSVLLNRVQDVTTNVTGVVASLFGIGSINVQSAGAKNEFRMVGIPQPEEMRDLILKYVPEEPKDTSI